MRNFLFFTFVFFVSFLGKAQQEEKRPDTTQIDLGFISYIFIQHSNPRRDSLRKNRSEAHWMGLDIGMTVLQNDNFGNSFSQAPYLKNSPATSILVNLNLIEYKFNFGTPIVGLTTGFGFRFQHLSINNNYQLFRPSQSNNNKLSASIDTTLSYQRNRLNSTYLTVPLLLEFNSSPNEWKSFYAAIGVVGGIRIGSSYFRKGTVDGVQFKYKEKHKFGLNPFQLDAVIRAGYRNLGFFVQYGLIQLFEPEKSEKVYPLSFGLSINI